MNDGPSATRQFELLQVVTTDSHILQSLIGWKVALKSFIGFDVANKRVVLSIRGSKNPENWVKSNLDAAEVKYPNAPGVSNPQIHPGFYNAWLELEEAGLGDAIKKAFEERPEYDEVLVTGHSLGGAIAAIAALELRQSSVYDELEIAKVEVVTFGSPRWCNAALAAKFNEVIDTNWRIVNRMILRSLCHSKRWVIIMLEERCGIVGRNGGGKRIRFHLKCVMGLERILLVLVLIFG